MSSRRKNNTGRANNKTRRDTTKNVDPVDSTEQQVDGGKRWTFARVLSETAAWIISWLTALTLVLALAQFFSRGFILYSYKLASDIANSNAARREVIAGEPEATAAYDMGVWAFTSACVGALVALLIVLGGYKIAQLVKRLIDKLYRVCGKLILQAKTNEDERERKHVERVKSRRRKRRDKRNAARKAVDAATDEGADSGDAEHCTGASNS